MTCWASCSFYMYWWFITVLRYGLFVLKVPLNANQPTNQPVTLWMILCKKAVAHTGQDHHFLIAILEHSLQEAQLMMTNLCDAFSSQSRSPNSTIPYVRYSYLLCNSNFIFKRRRFTIFDFKKCRDLEIGVRGHSRSLKMAPFERLCMVSYYCSLLILSLKAKMHHFWDIRLQNCRDLENRVRGPSRSLQMSPCDRAHMTSYCCSIVTLAVSCVVSEIFNVEKCRDLEIGVKCHSRSLRVVLFDRLCMVSY